MGKLKIFVRNCPKCNNSIKYKSHLQCNRANKINSICKRCSNQEKSEKRISSEIKKWSTIFGSVPPKRQRVLKRWKNKWNSFTEEKKQSILAKTPLQKIYFWGHINRASRSQQKKLLKKAFMKYRGENHWMKRPEVYAKIIESCKKYRGDNHWFRNPNYIKKTLT
jgi:hypothetical protein